MSLLSFYYANLLLFPFIFSNPYSDTINCEGDTLFFFPTYCLPIIINTTMGGKTFCTGASKLEVDEFSNPRNKEGTDQSTSAARNPLILVRNEQGDGRALTQSDLVTDSNNKSGLVKVLSLIVGVGSEQVALDSEWSIQLATEDLPGRLWKRTGQGKRTGTELGRFAVEFVIYKDLVQLVKDGVCGFNIEQEEDTIERIRKLYPWSSDKKYWVKPAYDGHKRRSEYCRERYEKKKAAAASPNSFDHDETTNPSIQAGEEGSPLSAESSSSSSSNKRNAEDENASANNIRVNKKSKQAGLFDFFKKK